MKVPAEHELIEFFVAECSLLDAGVPLAYNTATFERFDGSRAIRFVVSPGYGDVDVRLTEHGVTIFELNATDATAVELREHPNGKTGLVLVLDKARATLVWLFAHPSWHVRVEFERPI